MPAGAEFQEGICAAKKGGEKTVQTEKYQTVMSTSGGQRRDTTKKKMAAEYTKKRIKRGVFQRGTI